MNNILIVHQSAEMYGSDKTLLFLVQGLKEKGHVLTVVLPNHGPLEDELLSADVRVLIMQVLKVHRKMFQLKNLLVFPFVIIKSLFQLKNSLKNIKVDVVYSNTLAVLLGAFYAFIFRKPHIWHVHEIIEEPKVIANLFPKVVDYTSEKVIFNSNASKENLCKRKPSLYNKSIVVLNGLDRIMQITLEEEIFEIRKKIGVEESDVLIGLIGRINDWKGHMLLLESFAELSIKRKNVKLLFVGSTPENKEYYFTDLKARISKLGLTELVTIMPFQNDIYKIWDSLDIAVVPSTKPEPFGLVAIEAMLSKLPVVASNHGGVVEIVENEKSGLLFESNNKDDLLKKLDYLVSDTQKRQVFGENGFKIALDKFALSTYVEGIENVILIYNY